MVYTNACCLSFIPKRYVVCFLIFLALSINYILRFSIGLLITEMVRPTNHEDVIDTGPSQHCPVEEAEVSSNSSSSSYIKEKGEFTWDGYTQGIILSSFFWGYLVAQIPGGMLAERVGGKITLALGVLVSAVGSLVTPPAARWGGPWCLVAIRIIMGMAQGFTYPSINELLSKWAPLEERGRLGSLVFAGAYVGNVLCMLVSGLVLKWTDGDWAAVFYLYGGSGLVWLLVWQLLGYSRPEDHPGLSPSERQYMEQYAETVNLKKALPPTPWGSMLTSVRLWAAVSGVLGSNWGLFSTLTILPKYMTSVLQFSVSQAGLWSAVLYVSMCVGAWVSAMAIDCFKAKKILSVTATRKIFASIALLGPALFIALSSFAGCDKDLFIAAMILAMGLLGFECSSCKLNSLDLSPNYAGSAMALGITVSSLGGIVPPYLVGIIVTNNTVLQWRYVFLITTTVMVLADIFFIFAASGEIQPWNDPPTSGVVTRSGSIRLEMNPNYWPNSQGRATSANSSGNNYPTTPR